MRKFVQAASLKRGELLLDGRVCLWLCAMFALAVTVAPSRGLAEAEAEVEIEERDSADGAEGRKGERGGRDGEAEEVEEAAGGGSGGAGGRRDGGDEARGHGWGERGGEREERGDFSNLSDEQRERVRRAMGEVWQREDVRRARQVTEEANRKLREVLRQAMEEADPALGEIMSQISPDPRRGGERGRGSEGGGEAAAGPGGGRGGGMWAWPPGEVMVRLERAQQGRLLQAHEKVMADSEVKEAREALERFEVERLRERAKLREVFVRGYLAQVKELLPDLLAGDEGEKAEEGSEEGVEGEGKQAE